ncbi:hypothetical protein BDR04DRAFT_1123171 [Suillus decipiens]|nr:hypothetical protein BDR04DRAFT_1123171 [Suillus decipiens]
MARTKQTSKKTTGGPAKRGMLPKFKKLTGHGGNQIIKTIQSKAALSSGGKAMLKPLWHNIGSRSSSMRPYFGFEDCDGTPVFNVPATIHGRIEMASRSEISSNPILVLHFVLTALDPAGSPAAVMQHQLRPYRPNNSLQFHEIIFDIGTNAKADRHVESMKALVAHLKPLEYERVEIFVYTHSETDRGDIWGGFEDGDLVRRGKNKIATLGDPVAYPVDDFFAGLFVGGIEDYVRGATLWMMICGHTVREHDSFQLLKTCVKQYQVEHAFTFGATSFHACLTIPLVTTYVRRVLVEGFEAQEVISDLLNACPRFAMHSSIIHIHNPTAFRRRQPTMTEYHQGVKHISTATALMTVSTYTFFHDANRPFGNALPYQCSNCKCVRPWKHIVSNPLSAPNETLSYLGDDLAGKIFPELHLQWKSLVDVLRGREVFRALPRSR